MQEASRLGIFSRNRWVRLGLILDFILLVSIVAIIIFNVTKTSTIIFDVAPVDATISLNGKTEYTSGNTYKIHPGTYEVTISHPDLDTKTFSVDFPSNATTKITTFLAKDGDNFEFYEYEDHLESYEKLASIASASDNQTTDHDTSAEPFLKKMAEIMKIYNVLPIQGYVYADPSVNSSTAGYTIRIRESLDQCDKIACLLVNYYGTGYEGSVESEIKNAGFSPTDYQIIYERYPND